MYKKLTDDVYEVEILEASKEELETISRERNIGLSDDEMVMVQTHFKKEGRNPTDIELEAIAQSWSEHCCYKSSKPILKETVFNIEAPQNICVISEDAGVVDFDEDHAYVVALESHNHPSALDPYGGAATGVGGILRDVVCMGAQPIALIDPLFFGPLDYDDKKLPAGTKHPKYLFHGVVSGIADYGNRVGIPTVAGMVCFDESYVSNCLVNVGCIGIVPKDEIIHSYAGGAGDKLILAGGKTGRDGIHGVTFASAELDESSESESRPAVQLGYAIMKEPLMHACLEANRKKLLTGMKDFGGGGLSCVSAEMAHAAGLGATIDLDRIALKEPGVKPWEIWVSESQERMMVSVKPEDVDKVLEIFDFWDVPAAVVGEVDESTRIKATHGGVKVLDMDLEFLIKGVCYTRPYKKAPACIDETDFKMPDLEKACLDLLNLENVGSRESVIRRYDHEVRANTILKPMQGIVNRQTHGDAAVIKPLDESYRGLSITSDVNPFLCRADPYWGSASAVEEAIRNLVAVNSAPHSMADCLNFGNPEKEDRLGEFAAAAEGLYFVANAFGIPFVSGNVSLYNEGPTGPIAPTPTLLGVGIVEDVRKCVTSDLKGSGNNIYLVGETRKEMRGSQYYRMMGLDGGCVPTVEPEKTKEKVNGLLKAMEKELVKSCHDPSEGGLFIALAEMCLGGEMGVEADITPLGELRSDFKLFSESNGRWLVEVADEDRKEFEKTVECVKIGTTKDDKKIKIIDRKVEIVLNLDDVRGVWSSAIEREVPE
ncbi:MAG: phosphoribosylformylglycinamidine synthase subunit PurL [Candidatus Altiarchaeales archaeon]|nr:phosphoribosylformylglycinamidine synthase subunit PurL [Candidatus Altiarchaeales archaeon]MBD3416677.1 phosphoribosylformylglycinamidine synthase subunit PurL [Candidatus Altiarchaeales archaeon]